MEVYPDDFQLWLPTQTGKFVLETSHGCLSSRDRRNRLFWYMAEGPTLSVLSEDLLEVVIDCKIHRPIWQQGHKGRS